MPEPHLGFSLWFSLGRVEKSALNTVHSLGTEQLRKWPQVSPRNRARTYQRRINGICCYDGARLAVARFRRPVAMETTPQAKSSCRQSADALWVNPFKHLYLFISPSVRRKPLTTFCHKLLLPFCAQREHEVENNNSPRALSKRCYNTEELTDYECTIKMVIILYNSCTV